MKFREFIATFLIYYFEIQICLRSTFKMHNFEEYLQVTRCMCVYNNQQVKKYAHCVYIIQNNYHNKLDATTDVMTSGITV